MPYPSPLTDEQAAEVIELVHAKAARFVSRMDHRRHDVGDIANELFVRVFLRLKDYDPTRSSLRTYLHRVVDTAWSDLRRRDRAAKRDRRRELASLNQPYNDVNGDSAELLDRFDAEQQEYAFGRQRRPQQDLTDLRLDLESLADGLSEDGRQLLNELSERSVQEVARKHGLHRGTIYRRLKHHCRQFEDSSLREYLD